MSEPRGACLNRTAIALERVLDEAEIAQWWPVYEAAFSPLAGLAAARHLLTREEFAEEMQDPRILKLLARDGAGEAIAMTTIATDPRAVAWISPDFYEARYAEAYSRDALWYVGYTLAHPRARGTHAFVDMLDHLIGMLREGRITVGYDVSRFNDSSRRFAEHLWARARRTSALEVEQIDVQTYYAAVFEGPAAQS